MTTTTQSNDSDHKKSFRRSWRSSGPVAKMTAVCTAVAAAATVIYAGFAGWQLYEIRKGGEDTHRLAEAAQRQVSATNQQVNAMQGQLDTMREQATSMREQTNTLKSSLDETRKASNAAVTQANASMSQADTSKKLVEQNEQAVIATIAQAKAAQGSTTTAQDALRNAREQFQKDQRPYIWGAGVNILPIAPNKRLVANISFANYGKSPAIKVINVANIFHGKAAMHLADLWFESLGDKRLTPKESSVMIVPPGIPVEGQLERYTTASSDQELKLDEAVYILENDFSDVVVMRIEYTDTEGNLYRSDMCHFRFVTRAIASCNRHNEIH